jgi:hydroxyethylthiazole kinase-like uncharacterized protein yjeF
VRGYYRVEQVKAAEAPLLAALPDGTLMRRAAFGLATVAAEELRARAGGVAGREVVLLIGSGDNGGDALWAGALLRKRGARVTALLLSPGREHQAGAKALRRAGGRLIPVGSPPGVAGADTPASGVADTTTPSFCAERSGVAESAPAAGATGEHHAEPSENRSPAAIPDEGSLIGPILNAADLVLDGVVGISGRGPLRPAAAEIVAALPKSAVVIAVDTPSGVDVDTGATSGPAVAADVTAAFGARKPVHALSPNCGRVVFVPIGLDLPKPSLAQLDLSDVGEQWPVPGPTDDKYSQGVVGVVAGSERFPGAGVLCTTAAVAATSGMVRYAGPDMAAVVAACPEVVASIDVESAGRVQAWAVGPGMGVDDAALARLRAVLASDVSVVVDADGLTLVSRHPELVRGRRAPTVLTPHAGEFERLTGAAPGPDRVGAAERLAREWGVVVLLKGWATVVASLDGPTWVNTSEGAWSSTAGSGDVLSGVIGALLAAGRPPALAAAMAARAHALAAELAAGGAPDSVDFAPISAVQLASHLREAIRLLRAG